MRWTRMVLLMVVACFAFTPAARAATFRVTGTADGAGTCDPGTLDCTTLRAAVAAAAASAGDDAVDLPAGTYALAGAITFDSDVTVTGAGARTTTLAGDGQSFRPVQVPHGSTVAISGVTLRDGFATAPNAQNPGFRPGGVVLNQGSLTLTRVRVTGGTATSGGGIANLAGTLTVDQSLIDGNNGGSDSGGIMNFNGGNVVVRNTTIYGNQANQGGGYFSWGDVGSNTALFEHVTVGYNGASGLGVTGLDTLRIRNSIVANNSAANCVRIPLSGETTPRAVIESLGGNVDSGETCATFDVRNAGTTITDALENLGGDTDVASTLTGSAARDLIPAAQCLPVDQRGVTRPIGALCDAGAVELSGSPAPVIQAPAQNTYTSATTIRLAGLAMPDAGIYLSVNGTLAGETSALADGTWAYTVDLPATDGAVTLSVRESTSEPAVVRVIVDRTQPAPAIAEPATEPGAATLTFGAVDEPTATYACRLEGPAGASDFAPCTSPQRFDGLAAGEYRFTVRATDAAGNAADSEPRTFSVAGPPQTPATPAAPAATPAPTAIPTPTVTPAPTPTVNEDVTIRPTGKVLVKLPGTNRFVEVKSLVDLPLGTEIDTTNGRVVLRFESEKGKVQTATFYGGIFSIRQIGKVLELKLTEPLAACPKQGKAATAQSKPKAKKRKLWGDGKGSFRTSGKYSAATVRGTKWYVEDSCAGTLTRVTSGVVAVKHGKKTILLRAGKRYLARAPR